MPVAALPQDNPLARLAALFKKILSGVSRLALRVLGGLGHKLDALSERALIAPLMGFADALWDGIVDGLGAAQDAAEAAGEFIGAGLETLMGAADEFIEGLLGTVEGLTQDALEAGYEMALSLFEAIKKSIHLGLDLLAVGKLGEAAADRAQIPLDLIDNLLGNASEMASPRLGARARVLREDMYGQLKSARAASAARGGAGDRDAGRSPSKAAKTRDKPKPKPARGGR